MKRASRDSHTQCTPLLCSIHPEGENYMLYMYYFFSGIAMGGNRAHEAPLVQTHQWLDSVGLWLFGLRKKEHISLMCS